MRTVSDSVCSVPCYLLSMRLLSFSFTTFYCVVYHAILILQQFLSAAKSSRELQTARSFSDPKATVFFCFHLDSGGKWRFYLLRGEWNNFIECVCFLLHAVSRRSLWNIARSRPSGIGNSSCQFGVYPWPDSQILMTGGGGWEAPTEVHILYPKNHNFRIYLSKKITTFF